MSKSKNIEIIEEERMQNGKIVTELRLNKNIIGKIIEEKNRYIAKVSENQEFRATSKDEARDILIRDYHLHRA